MSRETLRFYTFGPFTINVEHCVLSCGDREIEIQTRAFEVLVFFVMHAGELVDREQIKIAVWGTSFLDDNNIDQRIAAIRRVLARYDSSREYIQNRRLRGWRFVAEVKGYDKCPQAATGVGGPEVTASSTFEERASGEVPREACASLENAPSVEGIQASELTFEQGQSGVRLDAEGAADGSAYWKPIDNRPQAEETVPDNGERQYVPALPQSASGGGPIDNRPQVDNLPHKKSSLPWLAGIAALAVAVVGIALIVASNREPHAVAYRPLTRDGRPKYDGPPVSDGRYVYFTERLGEAENGPARMAAVPIRGGEVVFPPNPVDPPATMVDFARNTQDIVYGRWGAEAGAVLFVWRQKQRQLERALQGTDIDSAHISRDGRSIAYVIKADQKSSIVVRDLTDGPPIRIIPVSGIVRSSPAWSPDGSRIRFPVFDPVSETAVYWEAGRDGRYPHPLPLKSRPRFNLLDGCWTADGRYFIYSESSISDKSSSLWIRRETGAGGPGRPVKLTGDPMSFDFPATALRGNTVFARGSAWKNQLDRYDARRGQFTAFWEDVQAVDVSFSNDGVWAAYRNAVDDTLWVCKSSGAERRQLTQPPLHAFQPHWSPDGGRIAFMGQSPDQPSRIFIVDASGGEPQAVKAGDSVDQGVPSWSADGRYLVFGELRQRRSDNDMLIRLLDLKTGTETVLPGSNGKWTPRWSPDGRYIVAVTTNGGSLVLFDCVRRRWMPLVTAGIIDDPVWSLDSRFVHFSAHTDSGRGLFRVRIADAAVQRLASYPPTRIAWSGVAPDGSPLVLNSTRIEEIYAIDFK